jgi:serine/threonine protein kinase
MESSARCLVCSSVNPAGAKVCLVCGASLTGDPAGGFTSALPPGTRLQGGLYTVGKVLGQGGFGITYLGSDSRTRRAVAIKEFFPFGSARRGLDVHPSGALPAGEFESTRAKFLDEARILARFKHPGIVDVYGSFDENNTAYMPMEFLRGRSLMKLLEERGSVDEREAIGYITRVGEALAVVHAANMLHRDLKPDNVMLADDGRVVLIDFGNARTFAAGKTGRMTTMVTPGYAPLEQYGQHVRFGPYTDVYALAATLYHLLTGHMPTDATDRATGAVLSSPRELNARVSPAVSEAVMWGMEIRIDRRPQTAAAFVEALRAALPAPPAPAPEFRWPEPDPPIAAPPAPPSADEGPVTVVVAGERLRWPDRCACCLEPADSTLLVEHTGGDGPFYLFDETRGWDVPYCSQCLEHVRLVAESGSPGLGRLAAAPLVGAALGGPIGFLVGLGGAAAASLIGAAARGAEVERLLRPSCTALGPAVGYQGWDADTHTFLFLNRGFADAFRDENAGAIVS